MEKDAKLREKMLGFIVNRYEVNHRQFVYKMNELHAEMFNYGKSDTMNRNARKTPDDINRTMSYIDQSTERGRFETGKFTQNGMELQTQYFCYSGYHQNSHLACKSYRYSPY